MSSRLIIVLLFITLSALARDPYPKNNSIDVTHYLFQLEVNDTTDVLAGKAAVTILFKKSMREFDLDLINQDSKGMGMKIGQVTVNQKPMAYTHQNNRIHITLDQPAVADEEKTVVIDYSGIPQDGFIISKNKFGDRVFFGDNWPDRGHHWLPCVDHPSDKARLDFIVIAPEHYQTVATGKLIEESNLPLHRKLTHWREAADVPVKVMTIGVARFSIQLSGEPGGIPVTTWVYPQNREEGFVDFAVAPRVLEFFQQYIGPFSYEKLAHVQSKTRWGGLENASNIFYFENSVNGKNEREALIAHETAHQWFGNSASEDDWHHVWLSEGFATYFTDLYLENTQGRERLVAELKKQRQQVTDYYKKNKGPVIDTTITDIGKVLSTNTYQKAGWVLHMLRQEIGDEVFHKTIRDYYARFQHGNAMTIDFQRIAEANSGKNLTEFFRQWLYKGGHPTLNCSWSYDTKTKEVVLRVDQLQSGTVFKTPLEIGFGKEGAEVQTVLLDKKSQQFRLPRSMAPQEMTLDPATKLLFEGEIKSK